MGTKKDLPIGKKFNNLTLLEDTTPEGSSYRRGLFLCVCGNTKDMSYPNVKRGLSVSCGCLQFKHEGIHGESGTVLHNRWKGMRARCLTKTHKHYDRYGGRGITICKEWEKFPAFRDWAIANGFNENLEIERIDNDLGYSPSNCSWVTRSEQMLNRNKQSNTNFKYIGVNQISNGSWRAMLRSKGKQIHIGLFETEIDAVKARNDYITNNGLYNKLNIL